VILAAYACWKSNAWSFDRMFSFAIWDRKDEVLFCARTDSVKSHFIFAEGIGFYLPVK
jgi:hypothetical protein